MIENQIKISDFITFNHVTFLVDLWVYFICTTIIINLFIDGYNSFQLWTSFGLFALFCQMVIGYGWIVIRHKKETRTNNKQNWTLDHLVFIIFSKLHYFCARLTLSSVDSNQMFWFYILNVQINALKKKKLQKAFDTK